MDAGSPGGPPALLLSEEQMVDAQQPADNLEGPLAALREASGEFRAAVRMDDRAAVPRGDALCSESGGDLKFRSSRALKRILDARAGVRKRLKADGKSDLATASAELQHMVDNIDSTIQHLKSGVKASLDDLWRTWEKLPEENWLGGLTPSPENVKEIITFAHKLCYTTFAPPGFQSGDPLHLFRPPAPQEQQFRNSALYSFAEKAGRAGGSQLPKQVDGANFADPLPSFEPPPGWKPGDPLPGQASPEGSYDQTSSSAEATSSSEGGKAASQDDGGGIGFDFILNPDLEVVDEEVSSEDSSSDDS